MKLKITALDAEAHELILRSGLGRILIWPSNQIKIIDTHTRHKGGMISVEVERKSDGE